MTTIIDGQGTTATVDGVAIGGIERYRIADGVTPDIEHNPIDGSGPIYLPGMAVYGLITLDVYRNTQDPGQAKLEQAREFRERPIFEWTLKDGQKRRFPIVVKVLPIVGGNDGVNTAAIQLKVAGPLIPYD